MKSAVVYGISGQDGAFLAKLLLEKKYRVIGISRDVSKTSFNNLIRLNIRDNIELISSSISNFQNTIEVVKDFTPDEIYNLAGQSSVALSFETPLETFESVGVGTLNLLEAVRILNVPVRLFNAGSSDCFGNMEGQTATEDSPLRPKSPYGVAKASAYWQVANYREAYDIFACTGILFNHESYLRPVQFVTRKIVQTACRIAKGDCKELVLGNLSIERDWGWAPEYVEAMWMMLQQETPDDYIIASGASFRLEEFVSAVFQRLGLNWKKYVKIDKQFFRPTDIQKIRTNPEKAEKKLKWKAEFNGIDVAKMMVDAELKMDTPID